MSNRKFKVSIPIGSWFKRQNLSLIWQSNSSVINCTNIYNEKKIAILKETVVVFWKWLTDCIKKEISFGLLFLLTLVFFAVGVIFYFSLDQEPNWKQFFITFNIYLGIFYVFRRYQGIKLLAGFLFCIVLGALAAKIETWRLSTSMLENDISTTLTGRIFSMETMENGRFRLNVDVIKTENPVLDHRPDRIRLLVKHLPNGLVPGDGLYGKVKLRAFSGPVYPGSYDFSFHNYFKGIGAQGVYLGKPVKISVPQPDTILGLISQKIENLRLKMTQRILTAIGGEVGNVSAALITGERSGISNDTNEALRKSGLAHVLSISGLHMALLSGMVLIIIRSFFACFPVFSSYYSAKKFAAIVALIVTAFYLVLSGAAIAAQRSFVMVAVMLFAILCNRSALTMRNFAISGFITLAIRPHEILSPGFQMSFSATAALIAAFGWWSERRSPSSIRKTTPSYVGSGLLHFAFLSVISTCASSLVAGSASGIYAAYHFSNVASLGIISNVLALPIISIIVMPFGLVTAFAMPFGLEWLPLQIMGFGVSLVIKIAHIITDISPVFNPGFMPLSALALLSIGLVGLTFFITPIRYFFSIFIFSSILVCVLRSPLQLIIADNMSVVGVINDKKLYIDRLYASKFTTSIWKKSFGISQVIKPTKSGPTFSGQFLCDDSVCTALLKDGFKISVFHGDTDQCVKADLTIGISATHNERCREIAPITFTLQQLLSQGSVIMTKNKKIILSAQSSYRPWNMHKKTQIYKSKR